MSVQAITWALSVKTGSPAIKAVLVALANYAGPDCVCWRGQDRIAADTELSRASVLRALKALEEFGLIERERRHRKDGSRTSDIIKLNTNVSQCNVAESNVAPSNVANEAEPMLHSATAIEEPSEEPSVIKQKRARSERPFPTDWQPAPLGDAFIAKHDASSIDLASEFDSFRDHHLSRANKMADWQAAWRTWIRKAVKFRDERKTYATARKQNSFERRPTIHQSIDAELSAFDRREDGFAPDEGAPWVLPGSRTNRPGDVQGGGQGTVHVLPGEQRPAGYQPRDRTAVEAEVVSVDSGDRRRA